ATRGTEAGAEIRGWRQPGVIEAGSKEVGDFAIWQNLRLFLLRRGEQPRCGVASIYEEGDQ
ncbi:MAG: hypothetical protein MR441_00805, partial [Bacteroidales bacterium]|nr:hypothetical protein [Bacteroidales bacterium]